MSDEPPPRDPAVEPPPTPSPPRPAEPAPTGLPRPRVDRAPRFSFSLVWLVPLVAVAIGASMLVRTVFLTGPQIEIEFASADGVEAGKTAVRYKEVVIGKVRSVSLRGDHKRVVVGVQLDRSASAFAVEDTSFWVVRPRIGAAGISGLGTLLSGAYIAADAGVSPNSQSEFIGLEAPPLVLRGEPGAIFVLRSDDLGSLDLGSPVFHKRTRVGSVVAYTLDADLDELKVKVFVEAPYQKLVTTNTRFWNASGIDLTLNASGLTLNTQTLTSVLAGGLAFEEPPGATHAPAAPENTVFTLFDDRRAAIAPPDGPAVRVRMVFDQTIRGLSEGAAVDLLGIEIGQVRSVTLQYDPVRKRFPIAVVADVFPQRLGAVRAALMREAAPEVGGDSAVLRRLVEAGLRAQLRTGNLLTGQLYVALDFVGKEPHKASIDADGTVTMPTVRGTLSEIQPQIAEIVQKVSKIPFEEIGRDLRSTLAQTRTAIGQLTPEAQKALAEVSRTLSKAQASLESLDRNVTDPNAPVQRSLDEAMQELQRTSRSLRVLSDYLQRHPEALLRGKPADPALPGR
ncbi:MAG: MlaD family protein [Caldimonas sp.]